MKFKRLVGYGEAMIRLTAPAGESLTTAPVFTAPVGGAELNAAIAAVRSGLAATWVSTLPSGPLGDLVARHCAAHGVTPRLRRVDEARLGLYFLEQATPPRASRIIYDRDGSAFATYPAPPPGWEDQLGPDTCMLITGISPALGPEVRAATTAVMAAAKAAGATVATDVNYRASLWTRDQAFNWLEGAISSIDILAAGRSDLEQLGVTGDDPYSSAIDQLGVEAVVGSSKAVAGRVVDMEVVAADRDGSHRVVVSAEVLDPVGAGDAMFGTFLAQLGHVSLEEAVRTAAGAAVSSYGITGDALTVDPWDLNENGGVLR